MNDKIKSIVLTVVTAVMLLTLSVWCIAKPGAEYSDSERRVLASFPEITWENILSAKFMDEFEDYTVDRFPMRDIFRSIKALSEKFIFVKKDNNDIYSAQGHLSKLEYPLNTHMLDHAADRFGFIYDKYLKDNNLMNKEEFLFFQTRNLPDRSKNYGKRKTGSEPIDVIPQMNNTFNQSLMRIARNNNLVAFRSHKIRKTFYSLRLRKMEDNIYANYILGHGVNRSDQSYILGMYRNAKEKQPKWENIFKDAVLASSEISEE